MPCTKMNGQMTILFNNLHTSADLLSSGFKDQNKSQMTKKGIPW